MRGAVRRSFSTGASAAEPARRRAEAAAAAESEEAESEEEEVEEEEGAGRVTVAATSEDTSDAATAILSSSLAHVHECARPPSRLRALCLALGLVALSCYHMREGHG